MKQFLKKKPNTPDPLAELEEDLPRRGSSGALWVTAISLILIVCLIVYSLPTAASSSSTVQTKVVNCQMTQDRVTSVLYGAGSLIAQEGTDLEVPQALEIQNYFVRNGDILEVGDPVAAFDPVAVQTAVVNLQSVLGDLDTAIGKLDDDTPPEYIKVRTEGRLKKLYAQPGDSVADVVYKHGALALLSLDGLMAVDLEAELPLGAAVTVVLPDGKELPGKVSRCAEGISTVTVPDDVCEPEDVVTVLDKAGRVLGAGPLYIHSELKVTGSSGTVDKILFKLNKSVPRDSNLMLLKNTGRTAEYEALLDRRVELEEQLDSLMGLGSDGILRAREAGIVSGVDGTVDYVAPEGKEAPARTPASPGSLFSISRSEDDATNPTSPTDPPPSDPSEPTAPSDPTSPSEPAFDFDSLPDDVKEQIMNQVREQMMGELSGMMADMMGSMMGGFGMGYGGMMPAQAPSYSTYDATRKVVATVTPMETMTVDFPVDELDILRLRVGMEAAVSLDALPGQHFPASVTRINTYGENSGGNTKYTVTVTLSRESRMLTGMNASVQITTAVSDPLTVLPAAAIQYDGGKSYVYTGYDAKTDTLSGMTQVQTGLSDGKLVELRTAFPEGTVFYYRYADTIEYHFERIE